jgi:hypothetical protein
MAVACSHLRQLDEGLSLSCKFHPAIPLWDPTSAVDGVSPASTPPERCGCLNPPNYMKIIDVSGDKGVYHDIVVYIIISSFVAVLANGGGSMCTLRVISDSEEMMRSTAA